MSRELLQQALNALRISAPLGHAMENYEYRHKVIKDIEAELAKPETPEDLLRQSEREGWRYAKELEQELAKPWQGLTDEDTANICMQGDINNWHDEQVIDATETKLKELNT
jgi:hypothetical protein